MSGSKRAAGGERQRREARGGVEQPAQGQDGVGRKLRKRREGRGERFGFGEREDLVTAMANDRSRTAGGSPEV